MAGVAQNSTAPEPVLFNPLSPGFADNPYAHYAELRRHAPALNQGSGIWVLSGYDEVWTVLRAPEASVEDRYLADGPMKDQLKAIFGEGDSRILSRSMLNADPPDHSRLRRLVSKAFTPKAVDNLTPMVESLVDQRLDAIEDAGEADLMPALALSIPFAVITTMLGMPETDGPRARAAAEKLPAALEPSVDAATMVEVNAADNELADMMAAAIAEKRRNPGDDLLTALIAAEDEGDRLTNDELISQTATLYIAGHDTTVNLIGNGVYALLRNPDQLQQLRDDPSMVPNAIEEFLRYDPSMHLTRRVMREPITLGTQEIPAGAYVMVLLASANRDERRFGPDADQLRVDREDARHHVTFSTGAHVCIGAHLARLQARIVFSKLVDRFPKLMLAGAAEHNGKYSFRGMRTLPVSVR